MKNISSPSTSNCGEEITSDDLNILLKCGREEEFCVLDCRASGDDIKFASRVRLPNMLSRRLLSGSLALTNVSPKLQDQGIHVVIIPGEFGPDILTSDALINSLKRDGFKYSVLQDSVDDVLVKFPSLRVSAEIADNQSLSSFSGCRPLQPCSTGTPNSATCSSSSSNNSYGTIGCLTLNSLRLEGGVRSAKQRAEFPVEILPYLYLGNAETARNSDVLDKYGITSVVNVTSNLPNIFEEEPRMRYLRISVDDNSSHNLTLYFAEAIAFIESARMSGSACLVHCLAGISRSVTICLAYLMTVNRWNLDQAYDLVLNRNASIAPNFHFMGQLKEYERTLGVSYPSSAPRSPSCAAQVASAAALLTPPPTSCSASPQSSTHSAKSFN